MKTKEAILTAIMLVNLIISGILIGAPIEETYRPIIIITMILSALYIIISENKIKIIRNKIDIFILLLGTSTLIPLIFNTAISVTGEINYIFKYISAILLYICIREHIITYPKTKKLIINTIIMMSVILVILGLDNLTTKVFEYPLSLINIKIQEIEANRLSSIFCYANALAIVIGISIILNNANYIQEENKLKKSLYGTTTTFLMMGLLLTYSRLAMLIIAIFIFIYLILLKDKLKAYDIIKLLAISLINSYIYNSLFFKLLNGEKYILMWLVTILINAISFFVIYLSVGIEKKVEKIKIRNILIVLIIGASVLLFLMLTITGNLDVFKNGRKKYEYQVGNIKANEEYTMNFEFGDIKVNEEEENLEIKVIEMDEFFDEIYTTEINEKEFIENKQIKIKMQGTTDKIKIVFNQVNNQCKIVINKLTINGVNQILDYKLVPDILEERIINTLISQKGLYERKVFIDDGLKIIKDNFLFGIGGNAWEYEQYNYQDYYYMASQMHSYIIQVGIEYGIVAVISVLVIVALIILKYAKRGIKKNIEQTSIITALLLLICHSFIDFDMTYLYIMHIFFTLIAILFSYDEEKCEQKNRKVSIIFSIIIFAFVGLYVGLRPYYDSSLIVKEIKSLSHDYYKYEFAQEKIDKEIMKDYVDYFKLEKNNTVNINRYFDYAHVIQRNATTENVDETLEKLEFIYENALKMKSNYTIQYTTFKYNECKLIADKIRGSDIQDERLKQLAIKFYNLVVNESKEVRNKLEKDYRLYRISKEESVYTIERIDEWNNQIQEILKKY